MIKLVALDIAGTTVDVGNSVVDALAATVLAAGVVVDESAVEPWMGHAKREAIVGLIETSGGTAPSPAAIESLYDEFCEQVSRRFAAVPPQPVPGAEAAMAEPRAMGIAVALTTGFSRDVAGPLLESLGWTTGVVDAVVSSDEVAAGRPAPYLIFRAMERTGITDVAEVLVAGDTIADLKAGTRAGCGAVVGVVTGKLDYAALGRVPHTVKIRVSRGW